MKLLLFVTVITWCWVQFDE